MKREKQQIGSGVIDELVQALIDDINSYDPDKVKADYERVMIEAGLMQDKPKIWVPKNESK